MSNPRIIEPSDYRYIIVWSVIEFQRVCVAASDYFAAISASISSSSSVRRYCRLWIFSYRFFSLLCHRCHIVGVIIDCHLVGTTCVILINIRSWFEEVRVLSFRFIIWTFHIATSSSGTVVFTVKPEVN